MQYGGFEIKDAYGIYIQRHGMYYEKYYDTKQDAEQDLKKVETNFGHSIIHKGYQIVDQASQKRADQSDKLYRTRDLAVSDLRAIAQQAYRLRHEVVDILRSALPTGTTVEAIRITDPVKLVDPGTKGVISSVNNDGMIYVKWETGIRGFIMYGQDEYKVVKP